MTAVSQSGQSQSGGVQSNVIEGDAGGASVIQSNVDTGSGGSSTQVNRVSVG